MLVQLFQLLATVVKNPVVSLIVGAVLAFGGRRVIFGIGLALMVYGAAAFVSSLFGFRLLP